MVQHSGVESGVEEEHWVGCRDQEGQEGLDQILAGLRYGKVCYGMVRSGTVCYGTDLYGMVWTYMVW